ncbi:MAG: CRISPR-associated protein Cas4, RecB family nuclease [Candidatus Methanohalarchaeum thermophilum]|uniref:CRISPR-associated exonuclease Cas4 n=1 Tax=Methanohalarchaeum thermophilum TaxID=1903181 RepID=A0A1Q6DWR2_METT1|nr:MAG: CRISPR-associated protein Cas4, RecB family nuclease [Candidatus Methanohalarchaeum thermophilum]
MNRLVNVSMLNQYLYCPRRFWYILFYNTQGSNYYRIDGKTKHKNQSRRGGWTKERYFESKELGLKGKIDILEDNITPVERKRGTDYYTNDEIQLAGYCMLLEKNINERIDSGIIYLFGTDQRFEIKITEWHRNKVKEVTKDIKNMKPDNPPKFNENPSKCRKCSAREYCMPEESKKLGED